MGRSLKNTSLNGSVNSVALPKGTTAGQPTTAVAGMLRYNTTLNMLEFYNGSSWNQLQGGTGGVSTITVDTFTIVNQEFSDDSSIIVPDSDYGALSHTPTNPQNVLVFLGGVYQPTSSYTINSDSTAPYIRMLSLVPGDVNSSLVIIHGFDSV